MKKTIAILALMTLLFCITHAAPAHAWGNEDLTFAEFYSEDSTTIYIVAAVAAALAVVVVLVAGPLAAPGAATIGSWIGGLWGLSGAAATNAGLALLGGGAIAAGGLGMAGGAAVLTAALTFGSSVTIDSTIKKYDEVAFAKATETMVALPPPLASRNIESLEKARSILEKLDQRLPVTSPENRAILRAAAKAINPRRNGELSKAERAQKLAFLALLQLDAGESGKAKANAFRSYTLAGQAKVRRTFPAALYAIASMSDPIPDFNRALDFLEFSAKYEDTNPLSIVMFAMFLDRLYYRADDIPLSAKAWDRLVKIVSRLPYDERKSTIESGLVSRMMLRSFYLRNRIQGLSTSEDEDIWTQANTAKAVHLALIEYRTLTTLTKYTVTQSKNSLDKSSKRQRSIRHPLDKGLHDWEREWRKFNSDRLNANSKYIEDMPRLTKLHSALIKRQEEFVLATKVEANEIPPSAPTPDQSTPPIQNEQNL